MYCVCFLVRFYARLHTFLLILFQHMPEPLPPFTLKNVAQDIVNGICALVYLPDAKAFVGPMIFVATLLIAKLIIAKVPYTEIDFTTYMQQIALIDEGEKDYSQVTGDTGPIVYPAGYVSVYSFIRWMTRGGQDMNVAQAFFGYVLTFNNLLVVLAYGMVSDLPPWPLYALILSKRLFSIYVLRLFNDCFTTLGMVATSLLLQQAAYWYSTSQGVAFALTAVAADVFSLAISVKMNALLYLPAFVILSYFLVGENLLKLVVVLAIIPLVQVMVGWRFLLPLFSDEEALYLRWTYINQAFDFSRKFLYKWTVNWRFIDEETFLSDEFAKALLVLHVVLLLVFIFTRFLNKSVTGKSVPTLVKDALTFRSSVSPQNLYINGETGPKLVLMTLATTNIVGVLCARSLHYQFLSWYCWQLPIMLYWTGWPTPLAAVAWIAHEVCWNVFPLEKWSSALLVGILSAVLVSVWRSSEWTKTTNPEDTQKKNE